MKKTVINIAVALLLSLGVTACGSSGKESHPNPQPDVSATELAAAKKIAEDARKEADTALADKKAAEEDLAEANEKLTEAKRNLEQASAQNTADAAEINRLKGELESAKQATETAQAALQKAQADLQQAQQALDAALAANANTGELDQLKAEKAAREQADKIKANFANSYFVGQSGSETNKLQNDVESKAKLIAAIEGKAGTCDAGNNSGCTLTSLEKGTILSTKNQSYSGYAVVREAYDEGNAAVNPINSYIAVVKTPTTNKAAVTNATYQGYATYTAKNARTMAGENTTAPKSAVLTLTVTDHNVSGAITRETGKTPANLVTLDTAKIQTSANNMLTFEGDATFHKVIGITANSAEGTYRGAFAGSNAEEVVGTFETHSTEKDNSVQGAFRGSKQ